MTGDHALTGYQRGEKKHRPPIRFGLVLGFHNFTELNFFYFRDDDEFFGFKLHWLAGFHLADRVRRQKSARLNPALMARVRGHG
jgi:hypothetical protein